MEVYGKKNQFFSYSKGKKKLIFFPIVRGKKISIMIGLGFGSFTWV
jgi:hypothetical protein